LPTLAQYRRAHAIGVSSAARADRVRSIFRGAAANGATFGAWRRRVVLRRRRRLFGVARR